MDKPEYFECVCTSADHVVRFQYDDESNEIYTEIQLNQYKGFFGRVWNAIKYIFKVEVRYGVWDCTILDNNDVPRLIKLLQKVKKDEIFNCPDQHNPM